MLLGLTGHKEVGKDTTYNRIRHLYGDTIRVERVGFADLIYRSAAEALGVSVKDLHEWKAEDSPVRIWVVETESIYSLVKQVLKELTIREFLQRYGSEAHRNIFGDDFWTKQVISILKSHQESLLVVTDLRLPSEARLIRKSGGWVVNVHGKEEDHWDLHATEQVLPPELVDFHLDNSKREDQYAHLDAQVVDLMEKLDLEWRSE